MSDYPEHDKQALVVEQTQVIGEFLEWLQSEHIQLMVWREDLTDSRPTGPECPLRTRDALAQRHAAPLAKLPCDPAAGDGEPFGLIGFHRLHCKHWLHPEREAEGDAKPGICCRCSKGRFYEVTGIERFVHEQRGITQLLADWAGIDLKKIEAEKRQMLAAIRAANGG